MIKRWRIYAFAAALALAALVQVSQIQASRIQISHWIGGKPFGIYVCQVYFPGGSGAISFETEQAVNRFAAMPQVDVILAKAAVRTMRSEVVVEAEE